MIDPILMCEISGLLCSMEAALDDGPGCQCANCTAHRAQDAAWLAHERAETITDALTTWVHTQIQREDYPHGMTEVDEADFWLRAFCAEVRSRQAFTDLESLGMAFDSVARELLGGRDGK